jgi:hypothetical protein
VALDSASSARGKRFCVIRRSRLRLAASQSACRKRRPTGSVERRLAFIRRHRRLHHQVDVADQHRRARIDDHARHRHRAAGVESD